MSRDIGGCGCCFYVQDVYEVSMSWNVPTLRICLDITSDVADATE